MGSQMQALPLQMMMGGAGGNPGMGNLPLLNMGNGMQALMMPVQGGATGDKNQPNMPMGMMPMMGMPQGLGQGQGQGLPQGMMMMQNPMAGGT